MNNILTAKKINGIPEEQMLMAEFEMDGPDQNTHGFQITMNNECDNPKDWFRVYLDDTGTATLIGSTDRMSKAIEIIAKYVQIQIIDEDDSFINLVDTVPNYDNDQDNLEDEEINKIIIQMVEKNHKI